MSWFKKIRSHQYFVPFTLLTLMGGLIWAGIHSLKRKDNALYDNGPDKYPPNEWSAFYQRQDSLMQDSSNRALYEDWIKKLEPARNLPLQQKADMVDKAVNRYVTYMHDDRQYNSREYFAAPVQTLASHKGDCDDSAILKYDALIQLGVSESRCFIVGDTGNPFEGVPGHAMTGVDLSPANDLSDIYILDLPLLPFFNGNAKRLGDKIMSPDYIINRQGVRYVK